MVNYETNKTEVVGIRCSTAQLVAIDRAWKQTDCMNRSQFIKRAINTLADEEIC